jgi:hypothetical protein
MLKHLRKHPIAFPDGPEGEPGNVQLHRFFVSVQS